MIDRDAPLTKCWAHNEQGLRCMQPGGHTGAHAHAIEWTDDECFDPAALINSRPVLATPEPQYQSFPEEERRADTSKCVVCSHTVALHPIGECVVASCDCKAVIPE